MTVEGETTGVLHIEIDSKLYYRGKGIRVEIRDSDLILIQPATTQRSFELPYGLYEISAVLDDGKRTTKVTEVNGRQPNRIKLEPNLPFEPLASKNDSDFRSVSELHHLHSAKTDMEIVDISSDVTVYEVESHWILRHSQKMEQVPVATIFSSGSTLQASLPISAGDHRFSVTCHVTRQFEPSFGPVQIKISQSRSIASAMERMVEAGQFESATRLANKAMETLLSKFIDPTGAALAALILYKADRLDDKMDLLFSLVKRFGWLPDGKILLASQLVRLPGQREKALQLACQASEQRILFTETFSLLLDLLRYWPDNDSKNRSEALSRLSERAPFVDWRSTYLCYQLREGQDANATTPSGA